MAIVKYKNKVTQTTGSFAGQIFKRNNSGHHIQSLTRRVNSPSTLQIDRRRAWNKLYVIMQQDFMSPQFIEEWGIYAYNHPFTTDTGGIKYINWFHWFFKINLVRVYNNLEPLEHPPVD